MLSQARADACLPAADMKRAKGWYQEKLGLTPSKEDEGGAQYSLADGTSLYLFPTAITERGGHTQVGLTVTDLKAEIAELRARGVVFEEYDMPGLKTTDGVVEWPDGSGAWFKDSEGNLLGLVQPSR